PSGVSPTKRRPVRWWSVVVRLRFAMPQVCVLERGGPRRQGYTRGHERTDVPRRRGARGAAARGGQGGAAPLGARAARRAARRLPGYRARGRRRPRRGGGGRAARLRALP